MRIDAERARDIRITLVEGAQLLGTFDVRLREYAARKLHKEGVHLLKVSAPCNFFLYVQSSPPFMFRHMRQSGDAIASILSL